VWPAGTSEVRSFRRLLERTETAHRKAADRLRASGLEDLAQQAEQFAAAARFDLDEPRAAQRLYAAAGALRGLSRPRLLFGKMLEGALSLGGADRGNLQLVDPATGSLVIVAEHGFSPEFLDYFAVVDDDRSACGKAAKRRAQTLIVDVTTDPGFAPHRAIAAASGFRAVLSTPLIGWDGRLIGVISTHYRRPHYSLPRERQVMQRYGDLAARSLARHLTPSRMAGLAAGPPPL
jgi:GAF domain-containing protein